MTNLSSPQHILQTDFRSGELDPRTRMRVDSKIYASGARSLLNTVLYNTGAAGRRPGLRQLIQQNGRANLIAYEFDEDEKYILSFQNNRLEIYDEDGTLQGTFTGSTDCPWATATIFQLTVTAFANTIFIANQNFRTKVLRRTGLNTFTMEDYSFRQSSGGEQVYQPYFKFEDRDVKIKTSATTAGTGRTITADTAIFSSDWVGNTIRIYGKEIDITGYTSTTVVTGTVLQDIEKDLDAEPFKFTSGSAVVEVTMVNHGLSTGDSVTIAGAKGDYGLTDANLNGSRTITYKSKNTFLITAGASATDSADGGGTSVKISHTAFTDEWDEQVFSDLRGWPQAVALHENRLWLGGSSEFPDGMFGSTVGGYYDFDVGDGEDDLSVQFTVTGSSFTKIRHIVSAGKLVIFSEGTEFVIDQREGEPITPGNASVRSQTQYGCGYARPQIFDGAVMFIQRNLQTVREYVYDFASDSYLSNDVTAAANHLIDNPFDFDTILGTTTRPEQYGAFVNDDGTVAMFHSIRQEQLAAWVPWQTVGLDKFDSVCCLGTKMFFSMERDGNYFLEEVEFDDPSISLDFAITGTAGSPTNSWALGSEYANQVVDVITSGNYLGTYEADGSGNIILDDSVDNIVVGYDYGCEIIPNAADEQLRDGAMTGTRRRVNGVIVHFRETTSASVNDKLVVTREIGQAITESPPDFNGKKKSYILGYDRDPIYVITQDEPLKMTVLGVVQEVSL